MERMSRAAERLAWRLPTRTWIGSWLYALLMTTRDWLAR